MLIDTPFHPASQKAQGDAMSAIYSVAVVVEGETVSYSAIDTNHDRINYSELGRMFRLMQRVGHDPYIIARDINCKSIPVTFWIDDNFVLNVAV
jgi:hypothetical protein